MDPELLSFLDCDTEEGYQAALRAAGLVPESRPSPQELERELASAEPEPEAWLAPHRPGDNQEVSPMRLLLVEDDKKAARVLARGFGQEAFVVDLNRRTPEEVGDERSGPIATTRSCSTGCCWA